MTALPDDAQHWLEREAAGEPTPWTMSGVTFLVPPPRPDVLDESYLTDDDLARPDVAANVAAVRETAGLVTWVAQLEAEQAFGYWHGPEGIPIDEAPIVVLDSEWQFAICQGTTISEALCTELDGVDHDFAALVELAAEQGVAIAADDIDDVVEPEPATEPHEHHWRRAGEIERG